MDQNRLRLSGQLRTAPVVDSSFKPMKLAAILLAAGRSQRMGRPKLRLRHEGQTMLERTLSTLDHVELVMVVTVVSAATQASKIVQMKHPVVQIYNPAPQLGLAGSLKLGFTALPTDIDAAYIVLADMPSVTAATYDQLRRALGEEMLAVVPVHQAQWGNPVLLSRGGFGLVSQLEGDRGLRSVLEQHPADVLEVEVNDAGVLEDIDTPEQWAEWRAKNWR